MSIYVADPLTLPTAFESGAGISVAGLHPGQFVIVTGFSGQFIDYEIDPRFPSDLIRF